MHRFAPILLVMSLFFIAIFSGGCAVYDAAVDERNVSDWAGDKNIGLTIEKDFLADDLVKYMDFDASSYHGHVYIIGEYESHEQVDRAVKIAKNVEGVRKVTTYLMPKRVDDGGCGTMETMDLYRRVVKALVDDDTISSGQIEVQTVQCHVVLLGIVGSQKEKAAAEAHAKATKGVRGVKNFITVE